MTWILVGFLSFVCLCVLCGFHLLARRRSAWYLSPSLRIAFIGEFQNETDESVLPAGYPDVCRERVGARRSKACCSSRFTCAASASFTRAPCNFRFTGRPPGKPIRKERGRSRRSHAGRQIRLHPGQPE